MRKAALSGLALPVSGVLCAGCAPHSDTHAELRGTIPWIPRSHPYEGGRATGRREADDSRSHPREHGNRRDVQCISQDRKDTFALLARAGRNLVRVDIFAIQAARAAIAELVSA